MPPLPPATAGALLARLFVRNTVFHRRTLLLLLLVAVDAAIAFTMRMDGGPRGGDSFSILCSEVLFAFVLPFAALQLGTAVVRDEVETGTLGYLLMRPISRPTVLLSRLAAAALVVLGFGLATTALNAGIVGLPTGDRLAAAMAAIVLGSACYTAFFTAVGVVFKRPFVVGIIWLLFYELPLSHLPMAARNVTVRAHLENIAGVAPEAEGLTALLAPDIDVPTSWAVVIVLTAALVFASLGAFQRREYLTDASS